MKKYLFISIIFGFSFLNPSFSKPPSFGEWEQFGPDRYWRDVGCKDNICSYELWVDLEPSGMDQDPRIKARGIKDIRRVTQIDCEQQLSRCVNCGEGRREWEKLEASRSAEAVISTLICPVK